MDGEGTSYEENFQIHNFVVFLKEKSLLEQSFVKIIFKWYFLILIVLENSEKKVFLRKWMVKAPHCTEEAWKLPLSTWRYLVLTVCDRNRLNKATLVPLATQTVKKK